MRSWPFTQSRTPSSAVVCATIAGAIALDRDPGPRSAAVASPTPPAPLTDTGTAPLAGGGTAPSPLALRLEDPRDAVAQRFKQEPRSGVLFDLDSDPEVMRYIGPFALPGFADPSVVYALCRAGCEPP